MEDLKKLADLLQKAAANSQDATPLHGNGGIWRGPGLDRMVVNAVMTTRGILQILPAIPSNDENPRYGILTAIEADAGTMPVNVCDDAPAGTIASCYLSQVYGTIRQDTKTIEMQKVALAVNRGDFRDLYLAGSFMLDDQVDPSQMNATQILQRITESEMLQTGVRSNRILSKWVWQGDAANPNEFNGLDLQIRTGIVDVDTGTACAAADSLVVDYALAPMDAAIASSIAAIEHELNTRATAMGLDPATWVIAMHPNLWYSLSEVWPCAYNAGGCGSAVGANSTVTVLGDRMVAERDAMRNGMYLPVNGRRYRVVTDYGIALDDNTTNPAIPAGSYASTIYFVPMSIVGGTPATYRNYIDYRRSAADVAKLFNTQSFFWTDNGMYSWAVEYQKWCYKLALMTQQRIILRTPQIAGRLDNVLFTPVVANRSPYPGDATYAGGGDTSRP